MVGSHGFPDDVFVVDVELLDDDVLLDELEEEVVVEEDVSLDELCTETVIVFAYGSWVTEVRSSVPTFVKP